MIINRFGFLGIGTCVIPQGLDRKEKASEMIQEGKLHNGLKVLVLEDQYSPVVTVQVWYRVGARNEKDGQRGIAHLLEHMMFRGSSDLAPEDHSRIINAVGGVENAATSDDTTFYYETVPVDRLSLVMELEAQRMNRLKLDEKYFYKEREVVKEELRNRNQNNPLDALFERFRSVAYHEHPYRIGPIGTMENLDAMSVNDLRSFYKAHYAPNNAVLIVVGGASFENVMDLAEKYFGPIPAIDISREKIPIEPDQTAFRREVLRFPSQLPVIIGGYKTPRADSRDSLTLDIVQMILGGGESCRLHKRLVRERQLAVFSGAWNWKMKDPGMFMVFGGLLPTTSPDDTQAALIEEIDKLAQEGPTADEINKAKNQLAAHHTFKLTAISRLGYAIGEAELIEGDYRRFIQRTQAYLQISAEEVKQCVIDYLNKERLTLAVLIPPAEGEEVGKSQGSSHAEAEQKLMPWKTHQRFIEIEGAACQPISLPTITRKTMSNGLKLLVIERHEQPVVYFDLIIPGGNLCDPVGKAGLTDMLSRMLTSGTTTRSAEQIALQVDTAGGMLHASAAHEYFSVQAQFLKKDFQMGLDLFADVVKRSTFPEDEFATVQQEHEASVRMAKDQPNSLAFETLNYLIYSYQHSRGRPASIDTIKAVSTNDIKTIYSDCFAPFGAFLCVTGDIVPEEVDVAVEAAFGGWNPPGAKNKYLIADPSMLREPCIRIIDKPDLTQSTIAIGHLGISRLDPDYYNLLLGNYILGAGGFSSRLVQAVRSSGGKTYSAGSWFVAGKNKGPFGAYTFTRSSETAATLSILIEEIKKIHQTGVTHSELLAAKNHIIGSYTLKFETPHKIAEQILSAEFFGLGEDLVRNYRRLVEKPSLEDVNGALQRHLDPDRIIVVVVGQAEKIMNQLSGFGKPIKVNYLDPVPDEERKID